MFRFVNDPRRTQDPRRTNPIRRDGGYGGQSDRELLLNFRSETWHKMNTQQRVDLLQEVENRNAMSKGRTPCKVCPIRQGNDRSSILYGYLNRGNTINVNVDDYIPYQGGVKKNPSYKVFDTVLHEGEHAHQINCIKNQIGPPDGLDRDTLNMCETEMKFGHYKKTVDYNNCTCEIDSNNAAVKKVMKARQLFRDDPEFGMYIKDRQNYYEKAANRNMNEVREQQSIAIDKSLADGYIDRNRYNEMVNTVVKEDQPTFEEAKKINQELKGEGVNNVETYFKELEEKRKNINQSDEINFDKYSQNEYEDSYSENEQETYSEEENIEEENNYKRR